MASNGKDQSSTPGAQNAGPGTPRDAYLAANPHAPINPSTLREAHTLSGSPVDRQRMDDGYDTPLAESESEPSSKVKPQRASSASPRSSLEKDKRSSAQSSSGTSSSHQTKNTQDGNVLGKLPESAGEVAHETTALLRRPYEIITGQAHEGHCDHGTFSPRMHSRTPSIKSLDTIGSGSRGLLGGITNRITGSDSTKRRTTQRLAEEHGLKIDSSMYLAYYIPFISWIKQYKWAYLQGDLVAALTMASFYLPMALSYASNLAHVPPINGLYSFVFNPLIYAFLGSCPQMVVGPEAAGSLLVGSVVRGSSDEGKIGHDNPIMEAQIAGMVTGIAGAVILIAGFTRLGFLENVLSRPFMRGFISSVGFIIVIDQLITELGLMKLAESIGGISHGSSITKLEFLLIHLDQVHKITALVAGVSFAIIMVCRELKRRLQPQFPSIAYVPDRFLVVVLSTFFCYHFSWHKLGLEILGEVKPAEGAPFPFEWPFKVSHIKYIRQAMGTSFLIALLGFFESSVAAKALGGMESKKGDGIEGVQLSPNRELVALGVANIVGGCFMSLPAFGGYGRSKVNASTGGKTPMSSIFLSIITGICILWMLPYFYYLPKAVLSSMITVVAWSLIEEAPHDIKFFIRIRAVQELALMAIIFLATIFYSLTLGIAIGVGLSLLQVIRHSTRPRIQILGRKPHTNRFESAEDRPEDLEFVEGCLVVKIPEPLTFANTGDLKNRLRRLEYYGTGAVHPALPRVRQDHHNRNVVFDIHGVTGLDGSGTQVLEEIVKDYRDRGVRVWFSRGPREGPVFDALCRSGILELAGPGHYCREVDEALRMTEVEVNGVFYDNESGDEGGGR